MRNSRTHNSIRNILVGFFSRIISILLPFFIRTIIINKLGADYVGLDSLFTSVLQVLSLTELGISSAIVFSLYEPIAHENYNEICEWMDLYRIVFWWIGTIILILGLCVCPFIDRFIADSYPNEINIQFVFLVYLLNSTISYYFGGYISAIIVANQRNDIIDFVSTIIVALRNLVQLATLYMLGNYYLYIIITPLFTLFTNILLYRIAIDKYPYCKKHNKPNIKKLWLISKQLKGLILGKLSIVSRGSLDSMVLSAIIGLRVLGIYSNYLVVISTLMSVLIVIVRGISASVGNSIVIDKKEKLNRDHIKFDFYYMFLISMVTICLTSLFQPLMRIWLGEELMLPDNTALLFCLYFYVCNMGQIRSVYSEGAGLWWNMRYAVIFEVILNFMLNIILGRVLGVNGILIATIISTFMNSVVIVTYITYKILFSDSPLAFLGHNSCYAVVTIISCFFIKNIIKKISITSYWELILCAILCAFLGGIILFIVYYTLPKTREYLKELVVKRSFIKGCRG